MKEEKKYTYPVTEQTRMTAEERERAEEEIAEALYRIFTKQA